MASANRVRKKPEGRAAADLRLREMRQSDIAPLCALARRIWRSHYPSIISPEQIEYMLARYYSEEAIEAQFKASVPRHLLAEHKNTLAGFITVRREKPGHWLIDKFYVDPALQGLGIGGALLAAVTKTLPARATLRLNVNRYNIQSINYYFRRGFAIERAVDTPYGPYLLEDYVMVKRL